MEVLKNMKSQWAIRGCLTIFLVGTFVLLQLRSEDSSVVRKSSLSSYFIFRWPDSQKDCRQFPPPLNETDSHSGGSSLSTVQSFSKTPPDQNSFLPREYYVQPGNTIRIMNVTKYFKVAIEDSELLHAAQDAATYPLAPGEPRIAFLFLARREIPVQPLWERFFKSAPNETYSIYVHSSQGDYDVPTTSIFYNRSIPNKPVERYSISLVDAMRRLLAFALLDTESPNLWFTFVCDSCIPIRSFPYVYNYFMKSRHSFVEAFPPFKYYQTQWATEPEFRPDLLRKGELWMSVHRRHAGMVVGETMLYLKFKSDCDPGVPCTVDEEYIQTMLTIADPMGIANRTVMYVDWSNPKHEGSPETFNFTRISTEFIQKLQQRTENLDGQYMDSSQDTNHTLQSCVYNGKPHSPCFLFARKFQGRKEELDAFDAIPASVLGY